MRLWIIIAAMVLLSPLTVYGATYEKDIKPIMASKCLVCHDKDAPTLEEFDKDKEKYKKIIKGPKMENYKNIMMFINGSDAGAMMRRLDDGKNTKDGKPGNMHQYLGSADDERMKNFDVFKKWISSWNLKKKAELSDGELKAITAPEK